MSITHRDHCQRQHRTIGLFLIVQMWVRNIDCIVLTREDLKSCLGLEKFRSARLKWFMDDLKDYLPYQERFVSKSGNHASLYLSKVPFEEYMPKGLMADDIRVFMLNEKLSPHKAQLYRWVDGIDFESIGCDKYIKFPNDVIITSYLNRMVSGLVPPNPVFGINTMLNLPD